MTALSRRAVLTGLLAAGLPFSARSGEETPPLPPIHFDVRIAGAQVGHHRLDFARDGDDLLVSVDIAVQVRVLFVTAFDYQQTTKERWRDGRLIAFESNTRDGDNLDAVKAVAVDDGQISVRSKRFGDRILPADIWPSTAFWRPAAIRRTEFLDAARGDIRKVSITAAGQEGIDTPTGTRLARKFSVDSSRDFDVWYGMDGDWLGLEWSGFGITARYRRI